MSPSNPDRDQLTKFLTEEATQKHNEVRKQLDILRSTRKSRGGVGAPLTVPAHLRSVMAGRPIIITDEDLKPDTPMPESFRANTAAGGADVKIEE